MKKSVIVGFIFFLITLIGSKNAFTENNDENNHTRLYNIAYNDLLPDTNRNNNRNNRNDNVTSKPLGAESINNNAQSNGSVRANYFIGLAAGGKINAIKNYLAMGVNVNIQNSSGRTALMSVILQQRLDMVKFLLANGADVNIADNTGRTALMFVFSAFFNSEQEAMKYVKLLIAKRAKINAMTINDGNKTPLDFAIYKKYHLIVKYLKKLGAKQGSEFVTHNAHNARNSRNTFRTNSNTYLASQSSLFQSMQEGEIGMIKNLVEAGADIQPLNMVLENIYAPSTSFMSTIGMAKRIMGRFEIIKYLTEKGINLNIQDYYGYTALMCASLTDQENLVLLFIKYGANPHFVNYIGETALDMAKRLGFSKIASILKQYEAKFAIDDREENVNIIYNFARKTFESGANNNKVKLSISLLEKIRKKHQFKNSSAIVSNRGDRLNSAILLMKFYLMREEYLKALAIGMEIDNAVNQFPLLKERFRGNLNTSTDYSDYGNILELICFTAFESQNNIIAKKYYKKVQDIAEAGNNRLLKAFINSVMLYHKNQFDQALLQLNKIFANTNNIQSLQKISYLILKKANTLAGLIYFRKKMYEIAYDKFISALSIDESYQPAKINLSFTISELAKQRRMINLTGNLQTEINSIRNMLESRMETIRLSSGRKVAVIPFDTAAGFNQIIGFGKALGNMFSTGLFKLKKYRVVERLDLSIIQREIQFSRSIWSNKNQIIKLGRLLPAEFILSGSYLYRDNKFIIDYRIYSTTTGEIVYSSSISGNNLSNLREQIYHSLKQIAL